MTHDKVSSSTASTTASTNQISTDVDAAWVALRTAALMGTERGDSHLPRVDGLVGTMLRAATAHESTKSEGANSDGAVQESAEGEAALLRAAAVLSLYRRAGRLPRQVTEPLPPACADDDQPACSAAAGQRLALLLSGQPAPLLDEWLALMAEAGKRAPEALLPALLDHARAQDRLVEPVVTILGKRGRWLAAQNPAWSTMAPTDPEVTWQTGAPAERRIVLQRLRRSDPAAARDLLAKTWSAEPARDRAAFLATLIEKLSSEDEPFLESSLDDRSKEVRRVAADLLAHLPSSHFVARMIERGHRLLRFEPGRWPLRADRLHLQLVDACDEAMQRDSVDLQSQGKRGEKATWTLTILSAVPPTRWSEAWQREPADLLALAARHDWADLLLTAWSTAAERMRDAAWAEALLRTGVGSPTLLAVLPPANWEHLLLERLRADRLAALDLLLAGEPLSPAVSRAVVRHLPAIHAALTASGKHHWHIRQRLQPLSYTLHPEVRKDVETLLNRHDKEPEQMHLFNELLDTLHVRATMHQEISE